MADFLTQEEIDNLLGVDIGDVLPHTTSKITKNDVERIWNNVVKYKQFQPIEDIIKKVEFNGTIGNFHSNLTPNQAQKILNILSEIKDDIQKGK